MTGTAESDDHSVTATLVPRGSVTGITLTERGMRHGPRRLSKLLMALIAQASADAAQQMAERVQELSPPADVIGMVRSRLSDLGGTVGEPGKASRWARTADETGHAPERLLASRTESPASASGTRRVSSGRRSVKWRVNS